MLWTYPDNADAYWFLEPRELTDREQEFRHNILRDFNLARGFVDELTNMPAPEFCKAVDAKLLQMVREIRADVIQSLVDLRSGLLRDQAIELIRTLAKLSGDGTIYRRGEDLAFLPPSKRLKLSDYALYECSSELYECVRFPAKQFGEGNGVHRSG